MISGTFEQKQREWDRQVASNDDTGAQVARPGTPDLIDRLVADIAGKFDTGAVSRSILDVGCGNGLVLSGLATGHSRIAGVDYSPAMIDKARILVPNGDFFIGEAQRLPFPDGAFDRVLCYSIFHYFPDDAYAVRAIGELVRVCAPSGVVLVGDLLDKSCERDIKDNSDLDYERKIPSIHRYSEWRFYDLDWLASQAPDRVQRAEILPQPADFALNRYRKDLRLCL